MNGIRHTRDMFVEYNWRANPKNHNPFCLFNPYKTVNIIVLPFNICIYLYIILGNIIYLRIFVYKISIF